VLRHARLDEASDIVAQLPTTGPESPRVKHREDETPRVNRFTTGLTFSLK
jgi:hypothetical protein